jgi:hypothetical protein
VRRENLPGPTWEQRGRQIYDLVRTYSTNRRPFTQGLDPALLVQTSSRTVPRMMRILASASPTTMARDRARRRYERRSLSPPGAEGRGGPALSYSRSAGTLHTAHRPASAKYKYYGSGSIPGRGLLQVGLGSGGDLTSLAAPAVSRAPVSSQGAAPRHHEGQMRRRAGTNRLTGRKGALHACSCWAARPP